MNPKLTTITTKRHVYVTNYYETIALKQTLPDRSLQSMPFNWRLDLKNIASYIVLVNSYPRSLELRSLLMAKLCPVWQLYVSYKVHWWSNLNTNVDAQTATFLYINLDRWKHYFNTPRRLKHEFSFLPHIFCNVYLIFVVINKLILKLLALLFIKRLFPHTDTAAGCL